MPLTTITLSELLGAPVIDHAGVVGGRVREVALSPQDDPARIVAIIVRTKAGDRLIAPQDIQSFESRQVRSSLHASDWTPLASSEGFLLLERDLLDQQIIDVHGRKVVRVNDVDFIVEQANGHPTLRISEVEIGPRGAVRRLLKGVVPSRTIQSMVARLPAKSIPWDFVDLIEIDPARRVRLKIEHERLSRLHPADIADILEELAPAQREAVFESLDEDVAAEALEEIDPKLQASLVESLDSDHAADIVEEMGPDAAADLFEHLSEETSEEILEEMEQEEREDVEELLDFKENSAAGRMTTDYLALPPSMTVYDAINALRTFEGGVENMSTIYLVDGEEKLVGAVALVRIALAHSAEQLSAISEEPVIFCHRDTEESEMVELFDKYNLITLPVVEENGALAGIITADDIISLLRKKTLG